MFHLVTKQQASKILNMSIFTLKKYCLDVTWIKETRWVKLNNLCIRYNLELIQDWLHNCEDPNAHHRAIDLYHVSLVSNQKFRPENSQVVILN